MHINDVYRGKKMANGIFGANKPRVNRQVLLMEYGDESMLKLGKSNGVDSSAGLKRERIEIMAEILYNCSQQRTKTDIMYKVNLNYTQLKKYLSSLTAQGLLVTENNKYSTTKKGYRFLNLFAQLNRILVL
jgi:predicted transcriptional regulator